MPDADPVVSAAMVLTGAESETEYFPKSLYAACARKQDESKRRLTLITSCQNRLAVQTLARTYNRYAISTIAKRLREKMDAGAGRGG